ncbi:glutamate-cysteine ligase family protein [Enemella evansiae]|uniref:glutamate-cysteine ligase family protein n=1 Tax=Enemella evansiae TaxID=2016499 RepID=UPI000B96EA10|nr:glutamate-cysteine ligase family protein [Enemella evansiae]PFG66976.1 glutamate-cysteine ligase [Propionibacteriaceae bacterium ES.041]OYO02270.1 glutamate--cysteine ligase [Enemella evansiae]OYO05527.1 glutamate--cysteine ligase [Enemella evansiae]OYO15283.1 glutamate--cysteine ligase [Enemella evansiae]TDO92844.1 glutamate-cysteine ligase [Enemella evansiae]
MGEDISRTDYSDADFKAYADRVAGQREELERLLVEWPFDLAHPRAGMEVELNLVDAEQRPALVAKEVLGAINDPQFVHELGKFNIELNLPPRALGPTGLSAFYEMLRSTLNDADQRAGGLGARLAVIGMLPTLTEDDLGPDSLVENPRYTMLDSELRRRRGGPVRIQLPGTELADGIDFATIAPEAACTSHQIHLQVAPEQFAAYWNASQAIAGVQLAMGANSPFFAGRLGYAESRIAVFDQATDDRSAQEQAEGARPRVWFGDHWIGSPLELFDENTDWRPLLPDLEEEQAGDGPPPLRALCLLNGTIYRWNRAVYDVAGGAPHLRIENRVLPAGPTSLDMVANLALYAGLTRALADQEHPAWSEEGYAIARDNFTAGQIHGMAAELSWPGIGTVAAATLVREQLLPLAAAGLQSYGVEAAEVSRYLGVIENRAAAGVNGATWQTAAVAARERAGEDRSRALRGMVEDYLTLQRSGLPVHEWER